MNPYYNNPGTYYYGAPMPGYIPNTSVPNQQQNVYPGMVPNIQQPMQQYYPPMPQNYVYTQQTTLFPTTATNVITNPNAAYNYQMAQQNMKPQVHFNFFIN